MDKLENGKYRATWRVGTVKVNGHSVTARSETLLSLTGAKPDKLVEVTFIGTREECEAQL